MDLELKDQQVMIQDAAAKFFAAEAPLSLARATGLKRADENLWRAAFEVGFLQMRAPESAGGAGAGLLDAALVCEAAGKQVAPIPICDGIAAASLLGALGNAEAALDSLQQQPLTLGGPEAFAKILLEGDKLVLRTEGKADVVLGEANDMAARYEAALIERDLLRAAWLTGAAEQAVRLAAAYACERQQFDRPIGSFQGIAFPLAESISNVEAARLMVWRAIWAMAEGRPEAAANAGMAAWWASTMARRAARPALRTFGGYGLSTEYDIHLYFLAINHVALLNGDPDLLLPDIGARLYLGAKPALPDAGAPGIEMGFGEKAEEFQKAARAFFEAELTPDLIKKRHHSTAGHDWGFHKKLAAAGLAYPEWPKEFGGAGRSSMESAALGRVFEEFRWTRTPIGCTNMGARMVMMFGSDELKAEVLPKIGAGEALSCLGFTEPHSGSDMYAARTRAVRDGADWLITGQKMFTTGGHLSQYVLMLARTDPAQTKHRGLTIFFVPMDLPGVAIQPVDTMQDERTNITFYDNVRVPDRYRLGEVDGGLNVMAAAMGIEHGGEGYHMLHYTLMDAASTWALTEKNGKRPVDDPRLRAGVAKAATHIALADLLCRRAIWAAETKKGNRYFGPMSKYFATEVYMDDGADLLALAAPDSLFANTQALVDIEARHRQAISQTIYGGTSEVHKGIVAQFALGMPKST